VDGGWRRLADGGEAAAVGGTTGTHIGRKIQVETIITKKLKHLLRYAGILWVRMGFRQIGSWTTLHFL